MICQEVFLKNICGLAIFCIFFANPQTLSSLQHHYYIVKIENKQRTIEKHKVEPSCFPTSCGCDSRADEEKHIHIKAEHYSDSANRVNRSSDVGDIKLIGFVEFKVVNEFFKHCGLPLSFFHLYYTTFALICQGVFKKFFNFF